MKSAVTQRVAEMMKWFRTLSLFENRVISMNYEFLAWLAMYGFKYGQIGHYAYARYW